MSDSRIRVGDLVVVVRDNGCTCPYESESLGLIFVVEKLRNSEPIIVCASCYAKVPPFFGAEGKYGLFRLTRLKRIDPLPLSELTDDQEDKREVA